MSNGVLLDTSYLISFVDPNRPHHQAAVQFFSYFSEQGIPMFMSTIAASEFHLKQPVTDLPMNAIIVLPFNLDDAMRSADLNFTLYKGTPGVARDSLKDDFKILGQARACDIAFVITEDARSLFKFCEVLRKAGAISTRAIKLEDGFDTSYFDPAGQHNFVDKFSSGEAAAAPGMPEV